MALLVRAARLVGPRRRGGRVLIQTFLPRHDVIQAALHADPGRLTAGERERREMLGLPPFGAYGEIRGSGSDEFVATIPPTEGVSIVGGDGQYVARADDWMLLGRTINAGVRPVGARLRIAVDPPR
jgi:primosomal protein N' (replication factor Y)